uniref:p0028E10.29 protein n=1 Tax=Oryza sativa subsp. japonica TaxID=39947 RepID=Q9AS63_ORYSJ|nr:P0028E10.29 [Oryza sativa Japonica Group]
MESACPSLNFKFNTGAFTNVLIDIDNNALVKYPLDLWKTRIGGGEQLLRGRYGWIDQAYVRESRTRRPAGDEPRGEVNVSRRRPADRPIGRTPTVRCVDSHTYLGVATVKLCQNFRKFRSKKYRNFCSTEMSEILAEIQIGN